MSSSGVYKRRIEEGLQNAMVVDPFTGGRIFCVNRGTIYLPGFRNAELIVQHCACTA